MDYEPLTLATIAFNPGSSASVNSISCYTLVIMDDDAVENDETISLSMSALTPVNIQQSTSFAVVTIREDASDSMSEIVFYQFIDLHYYFRQASLLDLVILYKLQKD